LFSKLGEQQPEEEKTVLFWKISVLSATSSSFIFPAEQW